MKVLLLYPNPKGSYMLSTAIALLSAVLKREGHKVKLFDTTFYDELNIDGTSGQKKSYASYKTDSTDGNRAHRLMVRPTKELEDLKFTIKYSNVFTDFHKEVLDFKPELIAMSCTEDMFHLGIKLLSKVKYLKIPTIAGGVFPTFAPKLVLSFDEIDIVCKGEGEDAIVELCKKMEQSKSYDDIGGLCIKKKDGKIIMNPPKIIDMDKNPLIDVSIFDEARYYKPMMGKIWRMFPIETHRGCPYKCAYCNSPSQMEMHKLNQNESFLRRKNFDNMRKELLFFKNEMKAEFLYFWADTFFSWTRKDFATFAELYQEIQLPFWCQTRPETITEDRVKTLKKMGVARIAFGIEHGNEKFRAKYLARKMSNSIITEGIKTVIRQGVPISVNNIIGFPHETRELAFDTIRLNKTFGAPETVDNNSYPFTPFTGTPLRKLCEELGYVKQNDIVNSIMSKGSLLNMPQFSGEEVDGLTKTFNMYVKFPEERWDEIRIAEKNTPEGNQKYNDLKEEFLATFWKDGVSLPDFADLHDSPTL
jgi:radical SAM superfamily enzyme YgiQ (UPF0313 family)